MKCIEYNKTLDIIKGFEDLGPLGRSPKLAKHALSLMCKNCEANLTTEKNLNEPNQLLILLKTFEYVEENCSQGLKNPSTLLILICNIGLEVFKKLFDEIKSEKGVAKLLISEVQKHSVLWNKWDKKYRDRYTTEKAWNDIAIKLKLDSKNLFRILVAVWVALLLALELLRLAIALVSNSLQLAAYSVSVTFFSKSIIILCRIQIDLTIWSTFSILVSIAFKRIRNFDEAIPKAHSIVILALACL
ncbi:hypothetical protein QTP88_019904 [Uroleucon formosanum]